MTIRTKKTKEEFLNELRQRIELRNTILDFVEKVYFPMMATKFNGKVYNVRFLNSLNEEASKVSKRMYVKKGYSADEIEIGIRLTDWNYNDCESILLKCITNNEGRIDYDATISDKLCIAWLENFKSNTEECKSVVANYDEYMKVFVELNEVLDRYNKLPYRFRGNMNTNWMKVY